MVAAAMEVMGFLMAFLGMIGNLVATLLPYWETSAHIGPNIVTAVVNLKGLWMECVYQSTGAFQCEAYNTILGLRTDLQAARAMMVISLILSIMACAVSTVGMQCTVCMEGSSGKAKMAGAGGCVFIFAGLMSLIPVSWKTHEVIQTFYHYSVPDSMKFEIGDCLYVGLASSLMSMLGGGLLSASCCDDLEANGGFRRHTGGYPYPDRTGTGGRARAAPRSVPYRPATLQTGINLNTANKNQTLASHVSTSSHSTAPPHSSRKLGKHNAAAASYDVTGYV
ncbi:claudin-2 isoform X2 [Hoplias malabaricus]|uniref:claudin-2 isoform X2 n=1 Tax=Hoplias malabaricus TaxID=27720 RepID=UPI00346303C0